jgi:transcription elongation factor GreA
MALSKQKRDELEATEYERVYLTPEGIERLHEKLLRLKNAIPSLAAEAKRTADFGDRSENFEYKQAKGALRGAHREILKIEDQLKRAVTIRPEANGKIQMGSKVVVASENGSRKEFEIVGPLETNPSQGRISHESPLGKTLMGHVENDTVTIKMPTGDRTYQIIKIK